MYQEFYRNSALLDLPLFTLIFFVIFFTCTVALVFFGGPKKDARFAEAARLPLAGEKAGDNENE